MCTSCVHALLHIPNDIRQNGPVWAHWSYVLERFCGIIIAGNKSRSKPYASISKRLLLCSQLLQIEHTYGLTEALNFKPKLAEITKKEKVYPESMFALLDIFFTYKYNLGPLTILRWPRTKPYIADDSFRKKIAAHLRTQLEVPYEFLHPFIPRVMESWDKVRTTDGGDCMRTAEAGSNKSGCDQSFVRVSDIRSPSSRDLIEIALV